MKFINLLIILPNLKKKFYNINILQILSIDVKPTKQLWLPQGWVFNNLKKFKQILVSFRIKQILNLFNIINQRKKSNLQVSLFEINRSNPMIQKPRKNLNGEITFRVNNSFSNHIEVALRL